MKTVPCDPGKKADHFTLTRKELFLSNTSSNEYYFLMSIIITES